MTHHLVFFLNQVPVYWASRKQVQGTAVSSAMAEIYAMADTVRCARLFKWRCEDMGMTIKGPIVLEIDNTQAISFQRASCIDSKLKGFISLKEAWVKELRDLDILQTKHIPTKQNPADLLTKCHPAKDFKRLVKLVQGEQQTRRVYSFVTQQTA